MKDVSTGVEVIENGDTVYFTTADSEGNLSLRYKE
jgi:gamma-glutamyltranspeptidase/glutathione hydrolase